MRWILILPLLIITMTACNQPAGTQSAGATTAAGANADRDAVMTELEKELAERGISLPGPPSGQDSDLDKRLASDDPFTVQQAIGEISGSRASIRANLPALTGLLDHEDEFVCGAAARALGQLGPEAAQVVPSLVRQIGVRTSRGGRWSGDALRLIDPAEVIRQVVHFTEQLTSGDAEAQAAAACALGSLGPVMAVPDAAGLTAQEADCPFTRPAGGIVVKFGGGVDMDRPELGPELDPAARAARDALAAAIHANPDPAVQEQAMKSILFYQQHARPAIDDLLRFATGPDQELAKTAAYALSEIPIDDPRTVQELLDQVDTQNWLSGSSTLLILGRRGADAADAVPGLANLITSSDIDPGVHLTAIQALGMIGPTAAPAVPALMQEYKRDWDNSASMTAQVFGEIGPGAEAAIPLLYDAVMQRHYSAMPAAESLARIDPDGDMVTEMLMAGLKYNPSLDGGSCSGSARQGCVRGLGLIVTRTPEIRDALIDALIDPNSSTQVEAANALRHAGRDSPVVIPALMGLLESNSSVSAFYGGLAIVENGELQPQLIPVIEAELEKRYLLKIPRGAVVMGWLEDDPARAGELLAQGLQSDGFFQYRNLALTGLLRDGVDPAPALPRLEELLTDNDPRTWLTAAYTATQVSPASLEPYIDDLVNELYRDPADYQCAVCYVLGAAGSRAEPALPALETVLHSRDINVQRAAAIAIAKIRGEWPPQP